MINVRCLFYSNILFYFFHSVFVLFCHIKYSEQQKSQQTPDKQSRGAIMRKSNQKKKKKKL